jgi:cell division inhibitor SepF
VERPKESEMAGVWRRTMQYLGLVEDEELEDLDEGPDAPGARADTAPVRRLSRTEVPTADRPDAIVRTMPATRAATAAIHRAEPRRFNEAREIGERFRQGIPVIMNLQGAEDTVARRLVDFASGLVFGLDGKIEMVASRVYLLTPADTEVSAEERERLVEGGFFNQF